MCSLIREGKAEKSGALSVFPCAVEKWYLHLCKGKDHLGVTLVAPGEGICPQLSLVSTFIMLYRGSSLHLHRFCFFIGWTFISFLICSVVLSEEHTEITNVKKK